MTGSMDACLCKGLNLISGSTIAGVSHLTFLSLSLFVYENKYDLYYKLLELLNDMMFIEGPSKIVLNRCFLSFSYNYL